MRFEGNQGGDTVRALFERLIRFTPSESWKSAFYQAARNAARELGIKASGLHRLRSNYAQKKYRKLRAAGKSKRQAKQEVSYSLGHNRIDVLKSYIPTDE